MTITGNYAILFVIIIRLLLKRFPKIFSYVLWLAVMFRLICPFTFESMFSLIPKNVNVPKDIAYSPKPEITSGITVIDNAVNKVLPQPVNHAASVNPMQIWLAIGEAIWIAGIAIILIYSIFTTVKLYRNLRSAKHIENNIYKIDDYKTPFVFGIINPKIYLPFNISESEKSYVLLHEQTHIKRLDHIVKPISFLITSIHWFNPLVWVAFYLMGEDMELSCDERVVKQMGSNIKKEYSSSLLSMSTGRKIVGGSPLAFGENNTKGRIRNVLNYKKPTLWVLIVAVIVVIIVIAGLIADPVPEAKLNDLRPMIMVNSELYLDTGSEIPAEIDESAIIGETTSSVIQSEKPKEEGQTNFGFVGAKYAHFEENIVVRINNKWILFEKEITDDIKAVEKTSYDKINAYLKEECIKVFLPYYELLDFKISDYKEEVVDGNIEAIFIYTVVHKNYDKDPDTVEYIKEAKERGDKNYQIFYDEYLQPQDMNFFFKVVMDKNDNITLYSNINPNGIEWEEVHMSDYIITQNQP